MEVGHAVAGQGMTREEASEIALKMLKKYEHMAADASKGAQYQECYDVAKALPTQEHLDMYKKVKEEIASLGIEFPY
jgi:methylamine--corrinoid protein Co-methyltransferase